MSDNEKHDDNESKNEAEFLTVSFRDSSAVIGGNIGPFKLLSFLGEGGYGIVYLAEQKHPIKRQVALKIIKPGMDSKQVLARFEAERQALALLDHPNIAHVLRAGSTESGLPYFAMEYIQGIPITEYCDHEKLSIKDRLKLFTQVCEAIQHAHQKGIIHRDIKPSNIMVSMQDGKAVPKVIDFGIAKAMSMPLTDKTMFTQQGQLIGTPEYISPEQADLNIKDIDTRTDIYSLGVVLYELLAGALPFDPESLREAGFAEIQRIIKEEEPPRPSTKLSSLGEEGVKVAQSRHTELSTLVKSLHKELEWIPLMAIRKERDQRYKTASDLAEDIQNYIDGNPLTAGPESVAYRFKKFVKKRRGLVAAVASIAAVLIAGFIVSSFLYIQAEQAHEKAQQQLEISQTVLNFINNDLLAFNPSDTKGEKVTIKSILDTAQKNLKDKFKDAPLVRASIYSTLGVTYHTWGHYNSSKLCFESSLAIFQNILGPENPSTLKCTNYLGVSYIQLGNYNKAKEFINIEILDTFKRILGTDHLDTLDCMHHLGLLYYKNGRYDRAEQLYTKIFNIRKKVLGPEHLDTLKAMGNLALVYCDKGNYDKAEQLNNETLYLQKRVLGPEHPDIFGSLINMALVYSKQEKYDKAVQFYSEVLENLKQALGREHPYTVTAMSGLATVYRKQEMYEKAEQLYTETLDIHKRILGLEHPDTLNLMFNLAVNYSNQGKYDKAKELYAETLDIQKRVLGSEHPDTLDSMSNLALTYNNQGDYVKSEQLYTETLDTRKRVLGPEHLDTLGSMYNLALIYYKKGNYDKAEKLYTKTLDIHYTVGHIGIKRIVR